VTLQHNLQFAVAITVVVFTIALFRLPQVDARNNVDNTGLHARLMVAGWVSAIAWLGAVFGS
jgi:hypothetical protein